MPAVDTTSHESVMGPGSREAVAGEALKIESLTVALKGGGAEVVRDVSLGVRSGEVLGLVGESGCGKTTVALAALGYTRRGLQVAAGRALLDGIDLLTLGRAELQSLRGARVAYVPQDPASALNPAFKVGFQLRETLVKHSRHIEEKVDVEQRLREVLVETSLDAHPNVLAAYPHQLSGGQQQRVALAMAFVCRPRLIVLDEPTTGLDVTTQRRILDTVQSLCATYGVAALYVTHDLAVVREIADRVTVMYAGELMEIGPSERIFARPWHPYTRALLRAIPALDRSRTLEGIEGQPPRPARRPRGCSYAARCPLATHECREQTIPLVELDGGARRVRCIHHEAVQPLAVSQELNGRGLTAKSDDGRVLAVSALSASYGLSRVLEAVDLQVGREECLALVGESGSGKTTLARCVVGLHTDWSGDVSFQGERLARSARARPRRSLQQIQFIFQNPYTSLNPRKSVEQVISQPLDNLPERPSRRERRIQVEAAIEEVSLGLDFLSQHPDQLSGGERQRVAIARALVVQPTLLVCDEVTSALDVSVQAIVVELLRRLQRERHLSILFITHNLCLVRSIAQRVAVLEKGRIVESGATTDVLENPQHPYTVRLLHDVPKVETHDEG